MSGGENSARTKPVLFFLLAAVLIVVGVIAGNYFYATGEIQYYVSPVGNDANPGTIDQPFKTITKATSVLRGTQPAGGAVVYLRDGRYPVTQSIIIDKPDSGRDGYPIRYASYQGEKAIIDGTIDLPTLISVANTPKLYKVDMSTVAGVDFRTTGISDITLNGQPQILARYPNYQTPNLTATDPWAGQFLYATSTTPKVRNQIKYDPTKLSTNWANIGNGVRAVIFSGPNYGDNRVNINSVDTATSTLNLAADTSYEILPNNRFYIENAKELLDTNGEWFYDRGTNNLFVYLDAAPGTGDVFSVVAAKDIFYLYDVSNITFENLVVRGSTGIIFNIRGNTGYRNVSLTGNEIYLSEREGINVVGLASSVTLDRNIIHDTGWEGINVDQDIGNFKTLTSANHQLTNNSVFRVGRKARGKAGIDVYSVGSRIANNEIYDVPRMGIIFKGNDNVAEYNKTFRTNLETADTGAIYTTGRTWLFRGNVVRNNLIKQPGGYGLSSGVWKYPNYSFGVYFDDFASGNTAVNNVVVGAAQSGMIIHGGRDNKVENNVFVDSFGGDTVGMIGQPLTSPHLPGMWTELSSMVQNGYDKTKYFQKYPELSTITGTMTDIELFANNRLTKNINYNVKGAQQYAVNSRRFLQAPNSYSDQNLFWSTKTYNFLDGYLNKTYDFAGWKLQNFDRNSLFADPKFTNLIADDYSFMSGSPALTLGILPIDVSKTGPQLLAITTPAVTIASPTTNQSLTGTATIAASVFDTTAISSVSFKVDGIEVANFPPQPTYQKTLDTTTYSDGQHTFSVTAINGLGSLGGSSVNFLVSNPSQPDTTSPAVVLTSPTNGSTIKKGSTTLTATASDNVGVVKVDFYIDGAFFRSVTAAPYTTSWNTRRALPGSHTILAKAYDAAGNVTTSTTVTVTK